MSSNSKLYEANMSKIIERNIKVLHDRKKQEEDNRLFQEKIADAITGFTGSMYFVYLHLALFSSWIVWNLGWLGLKQFDPSFVVLAMFASVEAIFLSTFVLISQNRMNLEADRRADLDLQVNLLTEHELTKLITIVTKMAAHMNVDLPDDADVEEISKDVRPERVMDVMEEKKGHDGTIST